MKHILILLFLFSTNSFSGEIDGKGIECWPKGVDKKIKEGSMHWFNNNRVIWVHTLGKARIPPSEVLSSHRKDVWSSKTYTTNANHVMWTSHVYFSNYLDRKTLVLEIRNVHNDDIVIQTCRVFTGFEEVIKKQDKYLKADEERERIREEKERKAREGNKI
ncbi:MAG: hypothetical protein CBC53_001475 [Alphaproteobacteria bacterium TMED93]|nr:MAG: hypothetical protein CBC53_001475 [Alphaproteobacteria bacterium TMED93]|tara:strand:+ start:2379 stop:2861 length:483 start_codon:yes stop_codon:yes gene_type:complete